MNANEDELMLVVASRAAFVVGGLRAELLDALPLASIAADFANAAVNSPPRGMIGRIKTQKAESADEVRLQLLYLSQAIKAVSQMFQEQFAAIVKQLQPLFENQDCYRFKHEYGVLTVEEMAERMNCTIEMAREQYAAGEIFAARAPGRDGDPFYPKFQVDDRLDKFLVEQVIYEHRDVGVSTTML